MALRARATEPPRFSSQSSAFLLVAVAIPLFGLVLRLILDQPGPVDPSRAKCGQTQKIKKELR